MDAAGSGWGVFHKLNAARKPYRTKSMKLTQCTECPRMTAKPYYRSDSGRVTKKPRCRECYERGVSRDSWHGAEESGDAGWGKLMKRVAKRKD